MTGSGCAETHDFLIVKHPQESEARPVLVSIPHYGTETLPDVSREDYADPAFESFPLGYVDRYAAEIYGDTHGVGATVLATPYSRMFVDVNRHRDDYERIDDCVASPKGVVRTHNIHDEPMFVEPLSRECVEERLSRYYDPYHDSLDRLLDTLLARHERVLLLDAHTANEKGLGEHEIVVSTARGKTARSSVADWAEDVFDQAGFRTGRDVSGYSGGHIVRSYGRARASRVDAVQIEINTALLMVETRHDLFKRIKRGEPPSINEENAVRLKQCMERIIFEFE